MLVKFQLEEEMRRKCLFKRILRKEEAQNLVDFSERLRTGSSFSFGHVASPTNPIETLREAAFKEGFAHGYSDGSLRASEELQAKKIELYEHFLRDMDALNRRIEAAVELWFQKAEDGLVTLAKEVAVRLIGQELQTQPQIILQLARETLLSASESTQTRIRVNPFDLRTLEDLKEELLASAGHLKGIEIVSDDRLSRGSVFVESESGVVDAVIETKIDSILGGEAV